MKTGKIIKKNITLLLRSRISTLVLIFGPLLVILLVGISFSTDKFNLNMGVYSGEYSEVSESIIETLTTQDYSVQRYLSEEDCIAGVKEGGSHACLIFPDKLEVNNAESKTIVVYVDQSKINLVYLVLTEITESLGKTSTEISKDLTDQIVTVLFETKQDIESTDKKLSEIIAYNDDVLKEIKSSKDKLSGLNLQTGSTEINTDATSINDRIDELYEDTSDQIDDLFDLIEEMEDYGSLDSNQSNILDDLYDDLEDLDNLTYTGHNESAQEILLFVEDINSEVENILDIIEEASDANDIVIDKLDVIRKKSESIEQESKEINNKLERVVSNINSLPVTNIESIVNPIKTEITPVVKSDTNLGFLFPSLVVMLIMFIGLLLPSTLIIMDKNSSANFRVFTTPTKRWLHVLGTYLTSMILIFFQLIIILLVSQIYFKIDFLSSIFQLLFSLTIIISFFVLLGMFVGHIFNSEEMAMMSSVSIGTLFLLTSGIIFPLESMPRYLLEKVKLNPVVLGSDVLRKVLFGAGFSSIKTQILYLSIFSISMIILIQLMIKSRTIQFFLKAPSRAKVKKNYIINLFDFGERKAKTLPEFIVSLQNLNENKISQFLNDGSIKDWILLVYKNKSLSKSLEQPKDRKEVIDVLVAHLKKVSQNKK